MDYSSHEMIGTLVASEDVLGKVFGSVRKLGFPRLVLFIAFPTYLPNFHVIMSPVLLLYALPTTSCASLSVARCYLILVGAKLIICTTITTSLIT
jgi:hypothetical protein